MEFFHQHGDRRHLDFCAFCAGAPNTMDHCPSRVLLDEPYPDNLPRVPACASCNASFSKDEEYLACLLGCILAGSTDPEAIARPKPKRILADKPALRARIENSRSVQDGRAYFAPELDRVKAVATKLSQGHALFELDDPRYEKPSAVHLFVLPEMTTAQRGWFEEVPAAPVWPEVGSRAMQRMLIAAGGSYPMWNEVQRGTYRFVALQNSGVEVRLVIDEYLGAVVSWED